MIIKKVPSPLRPFMSKSKAAAEVSNSPVLHHHLIFRGYLLVPCSQNMLLFLSTTAVVVKKILQKEEHRSYYVSVGAQDNSITNNYCLINTYNIIRIDMESCTFTTQNK